MGAEGAPQGQQVRVSRPGLLPLPEPSNRAAPAQASGTSVWTGLSQGQAGMSAHGWAQLSRTHGWAEQSCGWAGDHML